MEEKTEKRLTIALIVIVVGLLIAVLCSGCAGHITNTPRHLNPGEELIIGTPPIRSLSNW